VYAAVRLTSEANASEATEQVLIAYVKRELDSVKAPKHIHFVDALPRNAAGKVSRGAVRTSLGLDPPH
jgi:fatty-acyl-CoA synthase